MILIKTLRNQNDLMTIIVTFNNMESFKFVWVSFLGLHFLILWMLRFYSMRIEPPLILVIPQYISM